MGNNSKWWEFSFKENDVAITKLKVLEIVNSTRDKLEDLGRSIRDIREEINELVSDLEEIPLDEKDIVDVEPEGE